MRLDPSVDKSARCLFYSGFRKIIKNLTDIQVEEVVLNTIQFVIDNQTLTGFYTPAYKRVLFTSQHVLDRMPGFAERNKALGYEIILIEGNDLAISWYKDGPDLLALWEHLKATYGYLEDEED